MKVLTTTFRSSISLFLFCLLTSFLSQAESLLATKNIQLKNVNANAEFTTNSQLKVGLKGLKGSAVNLKPKDKPWDLSQYHGLNIELVNTSKQRITPSVKLTSSNSNKWQYIDSSIYLEPAETKTLSINFLITGPEFQKRYPQFIKMKAGPSAIMSSWKGIDLKAINQISFSALSGKRSVKGNKKESDKGNVKGQSTDSSASKVSYLVKNITAFTLDQLFDYPEKTSFPFVDELGQYLSAQYPGKLQSAALSIEEQWQAREQQELADLKTHTGPDNRSKWGGWLKGPKQKATGHFYTKQIAGKWWFVDPEGYLFWSHGVTGVGHKGANTLIKGRASYFKGLPSKWGAYSDFYSHDRFDFTQANLFRKYGEDWKDSSIKRNHQRLKSWGMNTYGNWSQPENFGDNKTPFTVAVHYKSKMLEAKFMTHGTSTLLTALKIV
ncbi:hypothetical protein [Colwellia sp. 12G3]|uniref:hypothetical protein n=1 Tax=Colwellia sp. 12G3 TaxID=2058299 RepID=UPI000C31DC65|nr:hypothetical protein [Colwellia sp. 12G3]PKI16668.1 hypothetical protein CXF71_08720 [Colwellia sp. 12G3]